MRHILIAALMTTALGATPLAAEAPQSDPLAPLPADQWDAAKAAHLLERAGFGGPPHEVLELALIGPDEAVARLVDYEKLAAHAPLVFPPFDLSDPQIARNYDRQVKRYAREMLEAARRRALLDLEEALAADPPSGERVQQPQNTAQNKRNKRRNYRQQQPGESVEAYVYRVARMRAIGAARRSHQYGNMARLTGWWLERMIETRRPLEEKMALFWHGHFATGFQTVRNARHMQLQNETFRKHATGNFRELVRQIARDPAMLRYLDGNRNVKAKPNENFARELMELFTIGRDNYSEQDIKEAARAFTGWTYRGERFLFNRQQHDYGKKTFFGKTGNFDGDEIIDIILADERTPRFIAWKLCRYFVVEEPSDALVDAVARRLRETNYQVKPVLRDLFRSQAFYAEDVVGRAIKSPAELVVGLFRQLQLPAPGAAQVVRRELARMGQELFQPPNVKGWDGGRAWINSATMLVRYNFSSQVVAGAPSLIYRAKQEAERAAAEAARASQPSMGQPSMGDPAMGDPAMAGEKAKKKAQPKRDRRGRENRRRAPRNYNWTADWPLAQRLAALETAEEVVDHLATCLVRGQLDAERRAKLVAVLAPGGRYQYSPGRMLEVLIAITSTPEYQLH